MPTTTTARLDTELRAVLDGTPIAHLATVLPDGGPHSVPLWIGTHDDQVAELDVGDAAVFTDVDTPEAYERLLAKVPS